MSEKDILKEEKKKIEKIVKGNVTVEKETTWKKFKSAFFGEGMRDVGDYLLFDILIPAIKNTIVDSVTNSVNMIFFGDNTRQSNVKRNGGRSYVSYDGYYSRSRDNRPDFSNRNRNIHNFNDITFENRGDAEEVLSNLVDLTIDYGQATVSDFYDLVGITTTFTDQKWGWTDLKSSTVNRGRNGYYINLPRTKQLD